MEIMPASSFKPPRYFPGYFIVRSARGGRVKWVMDNALMVPLSSSRVLIFEQGKNGYSPLPDSAVRGTLLEIQYAISIFDGDRPLIFKYNHPFETERAKLRATRDGYELCGPGICRAYPAREVMPEARGCPFKVIQFTA